MTPDTRPEGGERGGGGEARERRRSRERQTTEPVHRRSTSAARTRPRAIGHHEHTEIPALTASIEHLFPQLHTPHRPTRAHVISPTRTDEIDGTSEVRQWPSAASTTGNDEPPAEPTYRTTVVAWTVWTLRSSTVTDAVYRLVFGLGCVAKPSARRSPSRGGVCTGQDGLLSLRWSNGYGRPASSVSLRPTTSNPR